MEVIQFVALIVGIILGLKLVHLGVYYLKPHIGDVYGFLPIISFLIIFVGTIYLVRFIGKLTQKFARAILLGWLDRLLGGLISAAKWTIAISFVLWAATSIGFAPAPSKMAQYPVYGFVEPIAPQIVAAVGALIPQAKDIFEYIKRY